MISTFCMAQSEVDRQEIGQSIERIKRGLRFALNGLVDRDAIAQLILFGAITQEHLLLIGPPGTAKSEVVKRIAAILGGSYFEYLLGKFTEPSELFGPIDLNKLQEGRFETQTEGMLPEADFVFLDEVFLASSAILNTLLTVLSDRTFRRGHTQLTCPLKICVGASNNLPKDSTLSAFSDRFLLTYFVEPVSDSQIETLLSNGWQLSRRSPAVPNFNLSEDLANLQQWMDAVDISAVVPHMAEMIRGLRSQTVIISDRRKTKLTKLVAASALLEGRTIATERDIWPIVYAIQEVQQQAIAQQYISDHFGLVAQHSLFGEAAHEAVGTVQSLESVLISRSEQLLANADSRKTQAQAESLLKQIDASFAVGSQSAALSAIRQRLIETVRRQAN